MFDAAIVPTPHFIASFLLSKHLSKPRTALFFAKSEFKIGIKNSLKLACLNCDIFNTIYINLSPEQHVPEKPLMSFPMIACLLTT